MRVLDTIIENPRVPVVPQSESESDASVARREPPPPVILVEGDFLELGEVEAKALVPFEARRFKIGRSG